MAKQNLVRKHDFLRDKSIFISLGPIYSPIYYKYIFSILTNALMQGSTIIVADCNWDFQVRSFVDNSSEAISSRGKLRHDFLKLILEIGQDSVIIESIPNNFHSSKEFHHTDIQNLFDADREALQLGNSIRSFFARNYFGSSNFQIKSRKEVKQFNILVASYFYSKKLSKSFFDKYHFNTILVGNGRFPDQTAMKVFASENNVDFLSYEQGRPPESSYFLQNFQFQEFGKMQAYLLQIKEELITRPDALRNAMEIGQNWLRNQSEDTQQNSYLANLDVSSRKGDHDLKDDRKLAVIFNSSIDERFSNLGHELNSWASQKEATVTISEELLLQEFNVVVRIHPNTANKSWWDLVNLVGALKAKSISYILPWDEPNSYELLNQADLVLTWGSTISMESCALGIPTVVFGSTFWDQLTGATFLSGRNSQCFDFQGVTRPNPGDAYLSAFLVNNWGYSIFDYTPSEQLELLDSVLVNNGIENFNLLTSSGRLLNPTNLVGFGTYAINFLRRARRGRYASPSDLLGLFMIFLPKRMSKHLVTSILNILVAFSNLVNDGEESLQ